MTDEQRIAKIRETLDSAGGFVMRRDIEFLLGMVASLAAQCARDAETKKFPQTAEQYRALSLAAALPGKRSE